MFYWSDNRRDRSAVYLPTDLPTTEFVPMLNVLLIEEYVITNHQGLIPTYIAYQREKNKTKIGHPIYMRIKDK